MQAKNECHVINTSEFFIIVQTILENHYLLPLDGSPKTNLKDGHLERKIHGAIHASRATIWAIVMHQFLKEKCPNYVTTSLATLAQYLHSNEETALFLLLITLICHDAARQGEGKDEWEEDSAQIAYHVVSGLGLNAFQASFLASAISCKDNPRGYFDKLEEIGIDAKYFESFDYARKLINLGDTLDIMRCVKNFKMHRVLHTLKGIVGFDETTHGQDLIALTKAIQFELFKQGDLLFDCHLVGPNQIIYASLNACIKEQEKIKIEHAQNVLSVLIEDISKNKKIAPYLASFHRPKAEKYNGKMAYDPFIHGTRSSMLSLLPKSNFAVMSPLEMIKTHHAAPITGELTKGGYASVTSQGHTAFTKLSSEKPCFYRLKTIISEYTGPKVASSRCPLNDFTTSYKSGLNLSFSNINLLLIYLTRARQTLDSLEQVIDRESLTELREQMQATVQFYYFLQLLGTSIFPDVDAINELLKPLNPFFSVNQEHYRNIGRAAFSVYTFEYLVHQIQQHRLDIKAIVANPTHEGLNNVLRLLELPKQCLIFQEQTPDENAVKNWMELPITQFFSLNEKHFNSVIESDYPKQQFKKMKANQEPIINKLLRNYLTKRETNEFFIKLGRLAKQHVIQLEEKIQLFNHLIEAPQDAFIIMPKQQYFLTREFPVILLSEAEEKIKLRDCHSGEYRSQSHLLLGKDIKIIATDTNEHRLELLKYLAHYEINTVMVILFEALEKIKSNHTKPRTREHHSDGVPTLKWIAAQQVNSSTMSFFKPKPCSQLHSKKNINEIKALLKEAERYNAIQIEPCGVLSSL